MALELDRRRQKLPPAKLTVFNDMLGITFQGDVSYYKRLYDTWTFALTNWILCLDNDENLMDLQAKFFTTLQSKKQLSLSFVWLLIFMYTRIVENKNGNDDDGGDDGENDDDDDYDRDFQIDFQIDENLLYPHSVP